VPSRVAMLLPPFAIAAHGGGARSLLESLVGAAQHKAAALGESAHTAAELAAGLWLLRWLPLPSRAAGQRRSDSSTTLSASRAPTGRPPEATSLPRPPPAQPPALEKRPESPSKPEPEPETPPVVAPPSPSPPPVPVEFTPDPAPAAAVTDRGAAAPASGEFGP
jgi:hypothetical protein